MSNIGKISDFKSSIAKIVRPNLFTATLYGVENLPLNGGSSINQISDTFTFRCESAELPGRSVTTVDDVGAGGPALKLPYDLTYNDINISIICAEDMIERIFFELWIDYIVSSPQTREEGNAGLVRFHKDFARNTSMIIRQLNPQGETVFWYKLWDIFPTALTPMTANWEETNTYQRFGVTLNYRYYTFGNTDE